MRRLFLTLATIALLSGLGCTPPKAPPADAGTEGDAGVDAGSNACGSDQELCAAQGKDCGELTLIDRCQESRLVQCGQCGASQSCGGGGVDNVCGAPCPLGCPTGYTCNPFGACAGGSLGALALDVKGVQVGGRITFVGATPADGASCSANPSMPKAHVLFVDQASATEVMAAVRCDSPDFSFSTLLPVGTYRVAVRGAGPSWASIPTGTFGVASALSVSAPVSGLLFDVIPFDVSGVLTVNGAQLSNGASCTSKPYFQKATVTFLDEALGTEVSASIPCGSGPATYSAVLVPGTYRVLVRSNGPSFSNLPAGTVGVEPALALSTTSGSLNLDVKAALVSGVLTQDGATPLTGTACATNPSSEKATVEFYEPAAGTRVSASIRCDSPDFAFQALLPTGTYQVSVLGQGPLFSTLPTGSFRVAQALAVTGAQAGLSFDVAAVPVIGVVRLDGAVPATGANCDSNPSAVKAVVVFEHELAGHRLEGLIRCESTQFSFDALLAPGAYRVTARGVGANWSNLPSETFGFALPLVVTGPRGDLAFDVQPRTIAGVVLLEGQAPVTGTACAASPASPKALVTFEDLTTGTLASAQVRCDSSHFAFSAPLVKGTYRVKVSGNGADWANLPEGSVPVVTRLDIP